MYTRPRFGFLALAFLLVLLCSAPFASRQAQANVSIGINIGVFHDALAPYGNWVNHRTYGQVWYPTRVARNWRPYSDGYWAHTEDFGWLWVANEPWGWAPFHYGRWAWDDWYGWVWVPGRTWAPAWVFWRSGGGYTAWAPMPPNVVWQSGIGLNFSYFDYDRDLHWDWWVAVREIDLPNRYLSRHIYAPQQNRQIIHVTNYINNVTIINNNIVNRGVPVTQIESLTHHTIKPVRPRLVDNINGHHGGHGDDAPTIVRPVIASPTHQELNQMEELARRLDGKQPDGTRAEFTAKPTENPLGDEQPRVAGRLISEPVPPSPSATPIATRPADGPQTPPLEFGGAPSIPGQPLVPGEPEPQPASQADQQGLAATKLPPAHDEPINLPQSEVAASPNPAVADGQNPVPVENANMGAASDYQQRQLQIERLEQDLAQQQNAQKQQALDGLRQQQVDGANLEAQQIQQQERQRQQALQAQQQEIEMQQQAEREAAIAQQMQQQELQRQQAQQQQDMQQQAEGEAAMAQQQQERQRQQALQAQQQEIEMQQQAEREAAIAQQMQQQELQRQQAQQQQDMQRQAEREAAQAQQMQQQEMERQQAQQQQAMQQQAEREAAMAQQQQQQEMERQQAQQQQAMQQQAEREAAMAQQRQQQEAERAAAEAQRQQQPQQPPQ